MEGKEELRQTMYLNVVVEVVTEGGHHRHRFLELCRLVDM
jgi:hypothetical protein